MGGQDADGEGCGNRDASGRAPACHGLPGGGVRASGGGRSARGPCAPDESDIACSPRQARRGAAMKGQRREDFLTRERILVIVLVMATALTAWLCWRMVEPFVPALTWAVVLAVIAHPLHERILARLRWPDVAAALALVIVTVVIALPTALLVREVSHEAAASADAFHRLVDGERWKRALDKIEWLAPVREWHRPRARQPGAAGAGRRRRGQGPPGRAHERRRVRDHAAGHVLPAVLLPARQVADPRDGRGADAARARRGGRGRAQAARHDQRRRLRHARRRARAGDARRAHVLVARTCPRR